MAKIQIDYLGLREALEMLGRGVSSRRIIPAQQCVLVQTKEDGVVLTTANAELAVRITLDATVEDAGSLCVPYEQLSVFVKNIESAVITLDLNEGKLACTVISDAGKATIKCIAANQFPELPPTPTGKQFVSIRGEDFRQIINLTAFCVADPEAALSKPTLGCVLFEVKESILTAVATDTFHLAYAATPVAYKDKLHALVVAKPLLEVSRIVPDDMIEIHQDDNRLFIFWDNVTVTLQETEGQYPNISSVLGISSGVSVRVEAASLIRALRATSAFLPQLGTIELEVDENQEMIITSYEETNRSNISINAESDGAVQAKIGHSYLNDVLRVIPSSHVQMLFNEEYRLIIREDVDDIAYTHIIWTRKF